MAETKSNRDSHIQMEVQVHLIEYQKVRDEVVHQIGSASQSLLLSLSSASIILPILFSQLSNMPTMVLGSFLYILTIVYAVIGMHYATAPYYVNVEANYVHQNLAPKLNLRLQTTARNQVLQFENFQRGVRRNIVALYLSTAGAIATGLIILMLSLLSLLFARYVFLLPSIQSSQQSLALHYLSSFTLPLSALAWTFYVLSGLSQLLVMIYAITTGFVLPKSNKE